MFRVPVQIDRIAIALAVVVAMTPFCNAQEACDTVSIDSAGDYRIKHSKIKDLPTTHNRGGIALWVTLWPKEGSEDIVQIHVYADLRPLPTAECRTVANDQLMGAITCTQSIARVPGLRAAVKFRLNGIGDYKDRMADVLDYLTKDAFECGPPGTRI
jgi:hypothetical protein